MRVSKRAGWVCFAVLVAGAGFAESGGTEDKGDKSPFEVRIFLDMERDEVAVQAINRSQQGRDIHLKTLDRVRYDISPAKGDWSKELPRGGGSFRRHSSTWQWEHKSGVIRLKPGQSIGFRFSFCKHDVFGKVRPDRMEDVESLLSKGTKVVRYELWLTIQIPGKDGKPVESADLKSNTLRIDRATLDLLKASRERIEAEASEAKEASETKEAENTKAPPSSASSNQHT